MERFPFEEFVGLIVFVIIALSQVWGKLRQGRQAQQPEEPDFEMPDFGRSSGPSAREQLPPRLDDALREALGLPPGAGPRPVETARARPAAPPAMAARPVQQPRQEPPERRPEAFPEPVREAEGPSGGVLEMLQRLEQEAAMIRDRVPSAGRVTDDAGGRAEARMQAHLASLTPTLATDAVSPASRARSPMAALLADRCALRRAIVLNEILGPPRGVRPI